MAAEKREPENIDRLVAEMATDVEAFGELFRFYQPRIFRYVMSRLGNLADAEDITAITFEKALRNLETFNPKRAKFFTWLYQIASNATTDYLRKNKRVKVGLEDMEGAFRVPGSYDEESVTNYVATVQLLRQIPRSYQEVLVLRFFENFSLDEIAEILGCSKGNVSTRLCRGLNAMGKTIEKESVDKGFMKGGTVE